MYLPLDACLCCESVRLQQVLDLNDQPLANAYHDNTSEQSRFPLRLNLCQDCFHLQLSIAVNPSLLFKNYLYVSGTTRTLRDYFDWFAQMALDAYPEATSVLDIACNDGSQLDSFLRYGVTTYGVDPAENLHALSTSKGHEVTCGLLDEEAVATLPGPMDILVAQNVFAHNDYPCRFLELCAQLMHDHSVLFIQTSQSEMIRRNEFDTIYHEHVSFFNTQSMQRVVERAGLYLNDVFKTPIHGTSFIFSIGKKPSPTGRVQAMISEERKEGLYTLSRYDTYRENCQKIRDDFNALLAQYRPDHALIGYGAAAKGTVFLNFAQADLDFIADENALKHNLYIPGRNTPIRDPEALKEYHGQKVLMVPLAWNFLEEIAPKVRRWTQQDNPYLVYFPTVRTEIR